MRLCTLPRSIQTIYVTVIGVFGKFGYITVMSKSEKFEVRPKFNESALSKEYVNQKHTFFALRSDVSGISGSS
jgi:hypothetical protein